jgi:hypothetical protein
VLVTVLFGASGTAGLITGRPLIWPAATLTLSEAVALRDRGEVTRQIMLGADPNRRYPTHGVFRDEEDVALTPLEAAVITREGYMVGLVREYGAIVDDSNATILQCLAANVRADELRQALEVRDERADCQHVSLPWNLD